MPFTIDDRTDNKTKSKQPLPNQNTVDKIIEIAQDVFRDIFGDEQVGLIKPLFFKNRTLTVTCSSSVIAQEIRINHKAIIAKINDKLGSNEVDRIRYLV